MNARKTINNMKLGLFVFTGLAFLIFSLYMIGRNRNLFGSTFSISARFNNINGLVPGNNVRYSGIDIGTVDRIELVNDTAVRVTMLIDKSAQGHIRRNALASIGDRTESPHQIIKFCRMLTISQFANMTRTSQ